MSTATDRKRSNRALKRKINDGIISEEEAQSQFRRGNSSSEAPFDVQQQTSEPVETPWQYKGEGKGGSQASEKWIPDAPHANTEADVQAMFDTGYFRFPETPFWDGKNIMQVKKGTHCLWKNAPIGKRGGESTKTEFFHGEVHGWKNGEVIVS